jgi:hypothetical protein
VLRNEPAQLREVRVLRAPPRQVGQSVSGARAIMCDRRGNHTLVKRDAGQLLILDVGDAGARLASTIGTMHPKLRRGGAANRRQPGDPGRTEASPKGLAWELRQREGSPPP